MASIVILGAGRVGRAIAFDLSQRHAVTSADLHPEALASVSKISGVSAIQVDCARPSEVGRAIAPFDLVICAVPGFLGYRTLQAVLDAGKPVVDISFSPENTLDLHELALSRGVPALVDFGVAPGMDNFLLGYHDARMEVSAFECLVGGLPSARRLPFEYKAPFSPVDVIEEYTRPARLVEHGRVVTRPALSERELVDIDPVGTLEAFNTDGLRSLLDTMPHIPSMREKTLRYPGHARLMEILRDAGFFSETPLEVRGAEVTPLAFTSRVLDAAWRLGDDEEEFTVMRVTVRGTEKGAEATYVYDLYDRRDTATGLSSMARTTGFACTAAAELVLQGLFTEPGVSPPEVVGRSQPCFAFVMGYLEERGVRYRVRREG